MSAIKLHELITAKKIDISCLGAESCTGGGVSALITSVPGCSSWFWGTIVSYSNEAKIRLLGVESDLLTKFGAVSAEVVQAMLGGLIMIQPGALAYAISGIAGPGGGSQEKPVGLVFIGVSFDDKRVVREFHFSGGRDEVQRASVQSCIELLIEILSSKELDSF